MGNPGRGHAFNIQNVKRSFFVLDLCFETITNLDNGEVNIGFPILVSKGADAR